jgi:hypothetical protein
MRDGGSVVEISGDKFNYDNIAELTQNQKDGRKLSLIANSPYISLGFDAGASLSASHEAEAKFLKIKEILQERERWFSSLLSNNFLKCSMWLMIAFGIFNLLAKMFHILPSLSDTINYLYIVVFTFSFLLFIVNLFFTTNGYFVSINLEYSSKRQSFWVKNKDQILVELVKAILIVALTIVVGVLTNFITPPK